MWLFPIRPHLLATILLAIALFCNGCSHLPLATPLPDGIVCVRIGDQQAGAPFAVSPDGRYLALVNEGVWLVEGSTGSRRLLRPGSPVAVAWSPRGDRLSAAFSDSGGSRLVILSVTTGQTAESRVDGVVTGLSWLNDREVAAGGVVLKSYRFGTNAATVLYRWDGEAKPTVATLRDTTLRPSTAQLLARQLVRAGNVSFSPAADEVVFLHLHDPPLFTPYFKVIVRNLTNGAEREVGSVSVGGVAPVFAPDGERVAFGEEYSQWYDPWLATPSDPLPARAKSLAVSPGGGYLLADGTLYRNGTAVLTVTGPVTGRFSADGRSLFLASEGALYRIDGLRDASPPQPASDQAARLRELRGWRAEGLITPAEYRATRERVLRP